MSIGDDITEQEPATPTTTRLTLRYREHLEGLRRCVDKLPESALRESLDVRLALLAGDMGMGFPLVEEVPLEGEPPASSRNKLLGTLDVVEERQSA